MTPNANGHRKPHGIGPKIFYLGMIPPVAKWLCDLVRVPQRRCKKMRDVYMSDYDYGS